MNLSIFRLGVRLDGTSLEENDVVSNDGSCGTSFAFGVIYFSIAQTSIDKNTLSFLHVIVNSITNLWFEDTDSVPIGSLRRFA